MITIPGFNPTGDFNPAALNTPPVEPLLTHDPAAVGYRTLPFVPALRACTACRCRTEARQVVPGVGPLDARIMVIGQNPGEDEDQQGEPFLGAGGEILNGWLEQLGLVRERLVITNAVKCHTLKNRVPSAKELKTCSQLWLGEELGQLPDLQVVIPVGKPAATALLGKLAPPLTPLMAHHFKVRLNGSRELRVFPLPHPAFLLRSRHLAPLMRETVLAHLKLTLQQETPAAYAWSSVV